MHASIDRPRTRAPPSAAGWKASANHAARMHAKQASYALKANE